MKKLLAIITVPFSIGFVAHIFGRPITLSENYNKRTSDLMRYGIGAVLINLLTIIFCPSRIRAIVAKVVMSVTCALGFGVLFGFFISDRD